MEYPINGTSYIIDEFQNGFAWVTDADESPCFDTALEALQHAIINEQVIAQNREAAQAQLLEDEVYGTYQQQVNAYYNATR
jgi:hypothetical protein